MRGWKHFSCGLVTSDDVSREEGAPSPGGQRRGPGSLLVPVFTDLWNMDRMAGSLTERAQRFRRLISRRRTAGCAPYSPRPVGRRVPAVGTKTETSTPPGLAGEPAPDLRVVFFDGECGLCDRFVRFCVRHDRLDRLHFAPLQGTTFGRWFPERSGGDLTSLVFWDGEACHSHSTAVLRAVAAISGSLGFGARLLLAFPTFLRDPVYRVVARHRYRLFGGSDACALPDTSVRQRLLP